MDRKGERESKNELPRSDNERLVYLMPANAILERDYEEFNLSELWKTLWQGKSLIVTVTAACILSAIIYALTATEWYHAEVLLAPAGESTTTGLSPLGGLGGLASLAGVSVGGGGNAEAIAVLSSREFARAFIEDNDLLPVLFASEWDEENERWKSEDLEDQPDIRDAVQYFNEKIATVSEDRQTSLVTLSIEWKDPNIAAEWSNLLVSRLNDNMRQRALEEAEENLKYLDEQLSSSIVATLRQSIGRLVETELQKLMLAKGNEEFAFRVIDAAAVPKHPERPKRVLLVILAGLIGLLVSVFFLLARQAFGK